MVEQILFRAYLETISTTLGSEVGARGRALSSEIAAAAIGGKSCGMACRKKRTTHLLRNE